MTDDDQALLAWLVATVAALDRRIRDLEIAVEAELPALDDDPRHGPSGARTP